MNKTSAKKNKVRNRKIAIFSSAVFILILLIAFVIIPNAKTKRALSEAGKDTIEPASIGETVYFGIYDGEAIAWQVLDIKGEKVLLITKDCVDEKPYNDFHVDITWEDCTLRKWLNEDFIDSFSEAQQANIELTNVENTDNPVYGTDGGNDTIDKVFLLSIDEVTDYFPDKKSRIARYDNNTAWWWLRTPGVDNNIGYYTAVVYSNGDIIDTGYYIDRPSRIGVRPALWLNMQEDVDD